MIYQNYPLLSVALSDHKGEAHIRSVFLRDMNSGMWKWCEETYQRIPG